MQISKLKRNWPKKSNKPHKKRFTDKSKIKCFKCNKYGHFTNDCKIKNTIKQLKIRNKEQENLIRILEIRNTDSENDEQSDILISTSSTPANSEDDSSPDINFGCKDSCCKTINTLK